MSDLFARVVAWLNQHTSATPPYPQSPPVVPERMAQIIAKMKVKAP